MTVEFLVSQPSARTLKLAERRVFSLETLAMRASRTCSRHTTTHHETICKVASTIAIRKPELELSKHLDVSSGDFMYYMERFGCLIPPRSAL
jgi:hypothetical protein